MIIHGFQKMTLLDFPGRVACTIFTASCNLRCPFCHNAGLVTRLDAAERIDESEIFAYLDKRRGILDGVCITGGEPTLQADLADFVRRVRSLGYAVKLDTNGTKPDTLAALLDENLLDYVAMDVKNCIEKYALTAVCSAEEIY
jgi:pyruvate formate lyase activating enzyme